MPRSKNKQPKKYFIHYNKPPVDISGFDFYDFAKLNKIKDSTIKEIFIYDLLEYVPFMDVHSIYNELLDKLEPNGLLHIQGTDSKSLCLSLLSSQIDNNAFRSMIFGAKKINIMSFNELRKLLESNGKAYITKTKFINALQYYVECCKK